MNATGPDPRCPFPLCYCLGEWMPDARYERLRHFVSPEMAVVESRTTGTRANTRYDVHLMNVLTLREVKIAAMRSYRKVRP